MENYFTNNMRNKNIKSESMSPVNRRNNSAQIDLDYINKLYDKKNFLLQNKLFTLIIKFHSIFKKLITDVNSVLITLGNQAICSKSLLLNINKKDERISHLNDRLEMINDTKNLLDNNLLIANNNLNMFISEVQKNFKEFKELKDEKEKNIHHFFSKKRTKRISKNIKQKSCPKRKANNNNCVFLNSNPNESIKKNNIENKMNFMTTNSKRDYIQDNYMTSPKQNYFNYIKPNNVYLNFNRNENFSNEFPNYCQSPNTYFLNNKNMSPKKKQCNKSQEIIQENIQFGPKKINRSKSNFSSIANEKIKGQNNLQKRNYFFNDKKFNMSNINKKLDSNYFTNFNKNFKKINYRDKLLYKQNK
jgi:hypothetical protein